MIKMDVKDLPKIVLGMVLVGMLLGVGILIFDSFGSAVRDELAVTNESVTTASETATLANRNILSITGFSNNSAVEYTLNASDINFTAETGVIVVSGVNIVDGGYNVSYTYDHNSTTSTVMGSAINATSSIATTWLSLLITIIVLAIILGIVIHSFGAKR